MSGSGISTTPVLLLLREAFKTIIRVQCPPPSTGSLPNQAILFEADNYKRCRQPPFNPLAGLVHNDLTLNWFSQDRFWQLCTCIHTCRDRINSRIELETGAPKPDWESNSLMVVRKGAWLKTLWEWVLETAVSALGVPELILANFHGVWFVERQISITFLDSILFFP